MRSTQLNSLIRSLYPTRRTLCIEGAPGGGKTTIVRQVAEDLKVPYIEVHLPTTLVEDFGIPDISTATLSYKLPSWFPQAGIAPDNGILCFDDRNQASPDLQKVLANICQARTLHGVPMANWMVISTGNRQADRAGANRVLSHLRNRETTIELETNVDDWCGWAMANAVPVELISFMRFRPALLHDFNPQQDINPTPRSWVDGVGSLLGKVDPTMEFEVFKGAVGEGAAAEFCGYLKIFRELPSPDAILMAPDSAVVPVQMATLYALSGALAARVTEASIDRLCTYLARLPTEYSVLCMTLALRRDKSLQQTRAFVDWAIKHQSVLF